MQKALFQQLKSQQRVSLLYGKLLQQSASINSGGRQMSTYEGMDSKWEKTSGYHPQQAITFTDGKYRVFKQPLSMRRGEWVQIPYEVIESSIKNSLGIIFTRILAHLYMKPALAFYGTLFFISNYIYTVADIYWRVITEMNLLEGGHSVELKLLRGKTLIVPIDQIRKINEEKELAETYAEGFYFPISVGDEPNWKLGKGTGYAFMAKGHGAIINGEIFRAIINAKPILPSLNN